MKNLLPAAAVIAACMTSACTTAAETATPSAPSPKPNIVFILIDDMGWRDVGFMGSKYYDTPNIDRLSIQGMRFNQAYAACAVCSPTRASIMTGKYPARLHITDWIAGEGDKAKVRFNIPKWQKSLPVTEESIATVLKKAGYATAIAGKWHLGNEGARPENHGFDTSIGVNRAGQPGSYFPPYGGMGSAGHVPGLDEDGVGRHNAYLTDRLTQESQKFIVKHHAAHPDQPFFLYLAHYAVHGPLQAKPDLIEKYRGRTPDGGQKYPVYGAMVDSVDQSVGAILATLDQLKLRDNTLVVFTSDNGGVVHYPTTDNSPLRKGKGFAYEGGSRVPLCISWPGQIPAGETSTPVISTDFYPTLLAAAGVKPDHPVDGLDLTPLWRKSAAPSPIDTRDALFWHYPHYWNGTAVTPYSSVRQGEWKLIRCYESNRQELYNLKNDPGERQDLAKENPEQVKKLSDRLDAWLKETKAQLPTPK